MEKREGIADISAEMTDEERKVLWECCVRSGGSQRGGYIMKVKEMWDGRDVGARTVGSLISQLKCIEVRVLLSKIERDEIARVSGRRI